MSELTDELDYIWGWLQSTNLDVDCYNPGLTHQLIRFSRICHSNYLIKSMNFINGEME